MGGLVRFLWASAGWGEALGLDRREFMRAELFREDGPDGPARPSGPGVLIPGGELLPKRAETRERELGPPGASELRPIMPRAGVRVVEGSDGMRGVKGEEVNGRVV